MKKDPVHLFLILLDLSWNKPCPTWYQQESNNNFILLIERIEDSRNWALPEA